MQPVFDGHNDVLSKMSSHRGKSRDFFAQSDDHLDFEKAVAGGFTGGLFSIFVPSETQMDDDVNCSTAVGDRTNVPVHPAITEEYGRKVALDMAANLHNLSRDDRVTLATTPDELCTSVYNEETITAVMHLEGAAPLGHDLEYFDLLYSAGLRSVGLVWSRPNAFGHGVPFDRPNTPDIGPGLTERGKHLVSRCNEAGVVVDCAHLNEAGFWDVVSETTDPVVVSHTAAHSISPSPRNLTDEQIEAVADSNGIVGVMFSCADLHPVCDGNASITPQQVVDHIDHIVDVAGIDHVGFGSDFDGTSIPEFVGDASGLQTVVEALSDNGYSDDEIQKICLDNWVSVLAKTWS